VSIPDNTKTAPNIIITVDVRRWMRKVIILRVFQISWDLSTVGQRVDRHVRLTIAA